MSDNEKLIKMRDLMRKAADNIDEMLALEERADAGEDVAAEQEAAAGRFVFNMLQMPALQ